MSRSFAPRAQKLVRKLCLELLKSSKKSAARICRYAARYAAAWSANVLDTSLSGSTARVGTRSKRFKSRFILGSQDWLSMVIPLARMSSERSGPGCRSTKTSHCSAIVPHGTVVRDPPEAPRSGLPRSRRRAPRNSGNAIPQPFAPAHRFCVFPAESGASARRTILSFEFDGLRANGRGRR